MTDDDYVLPKAQASLRDRIADVIAAALFGPVGTISRAHALRAADRLIDIPDIAVVKLPRPDGVCDDWQIRIGGELKPVYVVDTDHFGKVVAVTGCFTALPNEIRALAAALLAAADNASGGGND